MIGLELVYWLMGLLTLGVAIVNARDATNPRRWSNALFWGLYAVTFFASSRLPHVVTGLLVIAMVLVASVLKLGQGTRESAPRAEREASAQRWGNRLFIPALTIPAVTLLGNWWLKHAAVGGTPLVDPRQVTLVSLAIATVVALVVGMLMLRPPASAPIVEARRLLDAVGWAAVLPLAAVVTYTVGMALFTMIMGNAFAAFPVMTAGIGLPLVMARYGGDPVVLSAVGMLSGYCGTLMTPMAANYNIVPAALLELPDEYAVIRVQIPTALLLLTVNTAIMYLFVYRK
jgi:uncharacterized membrane protein